ncbi:MAG TPA: acyltransferase [Acidimicrobiales bacterium]|nr:acyltransferase [Acidimicrobiales bacterium]
MNLLKGRNPALDGIRGFAVASVVWFHFRPADVPGGWTAICIFFPLSGFLITRLVVQELMGTRGLALKRFWIRRARRLFPAMFATLLVVAPFAVLLGHGWEEAKGAVWSTVLYVNNWWQLSQQVDYWAQLEGHVSPFEHLWSLSVEEQFYVAWPLIVLGVWMASKRPLRNLFITACTLMGAGVAIGFARAAANAEVTEIYYDTMVRSAEILAGALLAIVLAARPQWFTSERGIRAMNVIGWTGFTTLVVLSLMLGTSPNGFIEGGGMFVTSIAATATIAGCLAGQSLSTVLSGRVLVWLGTRSYGIYLFHWPVFVFVTKEAVGLDGWSLTALHLALTLAAAVLSYYLVEQRWLHPQRAEKTARPTPPSEPVHSEVPVLV